VICLAKERPVSRRLSLSRATLYIGDSVVKDELHSRLVLPIPLASCDQECELVRRGRIAKEAVTSRPGWLILLKGYVPDLTIST
jgi:hypothetical protein